MLTNDLIRLTCIQQSFHKPSYSSHCAFQSLYEHSRFDLKHSPSSTVTFHVLSIYLFRQSTLIHFTCPKTLRYSSLFLSLPTSFFKPLFLKKEVGSDRYVPSVNGSQYSSLDDITAYHIYFWWKSFVLSCFFCRTQHSLHRHCTD